MNNIDIHDIQLWAVALVGSFYNNLRKVPAHKRTTSVFKNVNNLEPLHLYVTEIPQSEVVKILEATWMLRPRLRLGLDPRANMG